VAAPTFAARASRLAPPSHTRALGFPGTLPYRLCSAHEQDAARGLLADLWRRVLAERWEQFVRFFRRYRHKHRRKHSYALDGDVNAATLVLLANMPLFVVVGSSFLEVRGVVFQPALTLANYTNAFAALGDALWNSLRYAAIALVMILVLGALAGYFGGRVDLLIQRLIEVVICIPSLFLILSVAAFIEDRSIFHIMVIIAAVAWTTPARLVRAEFLRHRNLDFVAAARAIGYPQHTIIFAEILPNTLGPVLVSATFGVASAILTESTMSFLGLGDITVPSWGQMLNAGRTTSEWTLILAPGFAIFVTVSLLNLVGDGFRDAIDPKLRR
jgi:ABC-type spermidine/putrescine transport system permease subunit II